MGFFDAFLKGSGDPDKDAAFNRGLIAAGLQLMQARGRLFPAIGQAGAAGLGAADQMLQQQGMQRRSALQDQMLRMQAEQFARQAQVDALPGKFMRQPSKPAIDATGGMETAVEAPQNASGPGGFDMAGYLRALQGMDFNKYLQTAAALTKQAPPVTVAKPGEIGFERTPEGGYRQAFSAPAKSEDTPDMKNYQQAVREGFKGTFFEYQTSLRKASANPVSLTVNADKGYAGEVATGLAKADVAAIDAARSAPDRIRTAREVQRILATEAPMTGTAATWRLAATKALSTAGMIDGSNVKSTEDLASLLAVQTLDAIKTSGLGSGQGFTDKDRQFLQDAKAGRIEINAGTLARIAKLNEAAALRTIEYGNKVVARVKRAPGMANIGGALDPIDLPEGQGRMPTVAEIEAELARRRGQ